MNTLTIGIGAVGFTLLLLCFWLISLSLRKQRLEAERKSRAIAYRKAIEKARQQEKKERLFKAETGHVPTMLYLAKEAERSNMKEALHWYSKAAQDDNINGMYGVVRMSNLAKDDMILKEQAKYWKLAIAALDGDFKAKFAMGQALIRGRGVEQNTTKGYAVINEAAEQGYIDAMLFMGDWCLDSDNDQPSAIQATTWYGRAASENDVTGMIKLGLHYYKGIGISQSHVKASYWLERASELGSAEAMCYAGDIWQSDQEGRNSLAYIWLFLSAHFGHDAAHYLRDEVGALIGVDTVVGLQSLAKPVMKKISDQTVVKHSIIKAFNKLYKRETYFPPVDLPVIDDILQDIELVNQQQGASHHLAFNSSDEQVSVNSEPENSQSSWGSAQQPNFDFVQSLVEPAASYSPNHKR
ncbi:hypothetical protein BCU68_03825 [Vibrio sp. 10N.286.49.B3]|uniref:tetratricopeptide repeat protein n=1 Tax=Vibrio sp. 10N.286.49.B3 TaxID=1880855 RepID=UPI000C85D741|nr:tetratricopeptide repeat protein [Vibrio sp. 10N.286.49.B3]PMH43127.1 hypothetical protein BCU68_03825 [Vibrio sp. 10N.286.49.B3]